MTDGQLFNGRLTDHGGDACDIVPVFWCNFHPRELADIGDDVEHAPPSDIHGDFPQVGYINFFVEMDGEGGHIFKGDAGDLAVGAFGANTDEPCRCFQNHLGYGFCHRDHSRFQ